MAFASVGSLGTRNSTTANQASLVLTTSAILAAGHLGWLQISVDNNQTTDGDEGAVTGVVDSAGNTWKKALEFTNGEGASQSGTTCSCWYITNGLSLASGGTITASFSNATARDAAAASAWDFTYTGQDVAISASNTLAADAVASPGSLNATTPNISCLRIRAVGAEGNNTNAATATATWTLITKAVADSGNPATSQFSVGEFIISTGTGSASTIATGVSGSADYASCYVAFREVYGVHWQREDAQPLKRAPVVSSPDPTFTSTAALVQSVPIAGIAFSQRFEEFKGRPIILTMPPAMDPQSLPAIGVSGIAFSQPLDYATPRKGRTEPGAFDPRVMPAVGISGVSWSQRSEPFFGKPIRFTTPQAFAHRGVPAVGISGVSWLLRSEPFYGRPIKFTIPQGFAHRGVPAVGVQGVAWAYRFEPFFGRKAFTDPPPPPLLYDPDNVTGFGALYGVITTIKYSQHPVNCYMEGLPQYRFLENIVEPASGTKPNDKVTASTGGARRLSKTLPTFKSVTKKGGFIE